jgi:hypothetical protein
MSNIAMPGIPLDVKENSGRGFSVWVTLGRGGTLDVKEKSSGGFNVWATIGRGGTSRTSPQ